jgi:hypothetical protein
VTTPHTEPGHPPHTGAPTPPKPKLGSTVDPAQVATIAGSLLGGYLALKIGPGTPVFAMTARDHGIATWAVQMATAIIDAAQTQSAALAAGEPVEPVSIAA